MSADIPERWKNGVRAGQASVRIVSRPFGYEVILDCAVPSKLARTLEDAERRAQLAVDFMADPIRAPRAPEASGQCPKCGRPIGLKAGRIAWHREITRGTAWAPRCDGTGKWPEPPPEPEDIEDELVP